MATINGTDLTVYIPQLDIDNDDALTIWYPLGISNSCSLSMSSDTPDASNKDSSGWGDIIGGQKSWTISFDSLVDSSSGTDPEDPVNGKQNILELWTFLANRVPIKIAFGVEADVFFYGDCYVNSLEENTDNEAVMSFSGSLQGQGAISISSTQLDPSNSYGDIF